MLSKTQETGTEARQHLHGKTKENDWFARTDADSWTDVFPRKKAVHARINGRPIMPDHIPEVLDRLHATKRSDACAAYVHVPYCESKCLYCGFFGGKYTSEAGAAYLKSLLWEIEASEQLASTHGAPIQALYLGGGTPTALQADELSLLLKSLRKHLPLANDCEITVEGRVYNFDEEKMEACLEAGVNRFSLGVQTFNTELRQMLGRIEPKEPVFRQLTILASYNQAAVVIDLIYGLPGQSIEDWKEDLRTFLDLPLDGVDLYQLNVFPGSFMEKSIASGKIPPAVTQSELGKYFTAGIETMQQARCNRLSISHWGRTTRERNFYNPMIKQQTDCLNFGVRSGGVLHGYFMANEPHAKAYMARCAEKQKPVGMMMEPLVTLPLARSIVAQMEVCRLNMKTLSAALTQTPLSEHAPDADTLFSPLLDNWERAGLIERDGDWAELTIAGQFWQVTMTSALLGWQNTIYQGMTCQEAF